jgi:hypothetical protein
LAKRKAIKVTPSAGTSASTPPGLIATTEYSAHAEDAKTDLLGPAEPDQIERMLRLSGAALYRLGGAIKLLQVLNASSITATAHVYFVAARDEIGHLLTQSLLRVPASRRPATELHNALGVNIDLITKQAAADSHIWDKPVNFIVVSDIKHRTEILESVLVAELQIADIYVITKRGGFDTTELAENGQVIFPADLVTKTFDLVPDARSAARCIAFDLPTAAAFHMHRVHEAVLRRYYDAVSGGKPHPENRNIGAYIDAMKNHHVGDKNLFGVLANVKNFHRNPVLHPEDHLDSIEEAIQLLGIVNSSIGYMLKALPVTPTDTSSKEELGATGKAKPDAA